MRTPIGHRRAVAGAPNEAGRIFQGPGSEPDLASFLSTVNTPEMSLPKKNP
ncbi:hypothetical protein [Rhodanobacter sp. Root179]|uniref:hypothetical protein n=1 Tax=Rhodanobacter sp. Root179 TaxID=1736482 RepID=UPI000AB668B4|nr:hypothetical protein [Rhodanobacter sp. Root179]